MPSNTTSDKEVESARERVERLREEVREERAAQAAEMRSNENAYLKDRLDSEAERYEAELKELRGTVDPAAVAPTPPKTQPDAKSEDDDKE